MCAAETFEDVPSGTHTSSAHLRSLLPFPRALSIRLFDVVTQKTRLLPGGSERRAGIGALPLHRLQSAAENAWRWSRPGGSPDPVTRRRKPIAIC